jgi:CoA:oxalate CoA-transferase
VADSIAPLADLVVLDFTRVLAGPYCTRLLADLGARVVKVERAGGGDDMRKGHLQLEPGRDDQSSYFTRINVGKESLGLDLGRPETREIVRDLARKADVAVENFAPGVAARLGIDYESLAAGKPDLVYGSISGFGQTGPWRERRASCTSTRAMHRRRDPRTSRRRTCSRARTPSAPSWPRCGAASGREWARGSTSRCSRP